MFLVAIDEAGAMIRDKITKQPAEFWNWRRAISYLRASVFFVIADTNSRLSNFAPHIGHDPSLFAATGKDLVYPFYIVHTRKGISLPKCLVHRTIHVSDFGVRLFKLAYL